MNTDVLPAKCKAYHETVECARSRFETVIGILVRVQELQQNQIDVSTLLARLPVYLRLSSLKRSR